MSHNSEVQQSRCRVYKGAVDLINRRLPKELLIKVFSYLGRRYGLRAASVCRAWRDLIIISSRYDGGGHHPQPEIIGSTSLTLRPPVARPPRPCVCVLDTYSNSLLKFWVFDGDVDWYAREYDLHDRLQKVLEKDLEEKRVYLNTDIHEEDIGLFSTGPRPYMVGGAGSWMFFELVLLPDLPHDSDARPALYAYNPSTETLELVSYPASGRGEFNSRSMFLDGRSGAYKVAELYADDSSTGLSRTHIFDSTTKTCRFILHEPPPSFRTWKDHWQQPVTFGNQERLSGPFCTRMVIFSTPSGRDLVFCRTGGRGWLYYYNLINPPPASHHQSGLVGSEHVGWIPVIGSPYGKGTRFRSPEGYHLIKFCDSRLLAVGCRHWCVKVGEDVPKTVRNILNNNLLQIWELEGFTPLEHLKKEKKSKSAAATSESGSGRPRWRCLTSMPREFQCHLWGFSKCSYFKGKSRYTFLDISRQIQCFPLGNYLYFHTPLGSRMVTFHYPSRAWQCLCLPPPPLSEKEEPPSDYPLENKYKPLNACPLIV